MLILAFHLIVFAVLGFLATAFLTNFLFWYEAINEPCARINTPKPSLRNCLAMYGRTLLGYLTGIFYHPRGWLPYVVPAKPHLPPQADKAPLLLIHGVYHNGATWLYHKKRLQAAGHPVVVFSYHSFYKSLDDILYGLDNQVTELEKRYPDRKPILIGHSLGGLLIRRWLMRDKANSDRIGGVITMATPHHGSRIAAVAAGRLVNSIAPKGSLITDLEGQTFSPDLCCRALLSNTDESVLPPCNLLPPEGWAIRVIPNVSHFGFLVGSNQTQILLEEVTAIESFQAARCVSDENQ